MNETQIEDAEEECDVTKISENKHEKIYFEKKLAKQSHLNTKEKENLWLSEKNIRIYLKEKLDTMEAARLSYGSKKKQVKGTNTNLMVLLNHIKNLWNTF